MIAMTLHPIIEFASKALLVMCVPLLPFYDMVYTSECLCAYMYRCMCTYTYIYIYVYVYIS